MGVPTLSPISHLLCNLSLAMLGGGGGIHAAVG